MPGIYPGTYKNTITKEVGGKAKGLLFLTQNHFLVPQFYILDFTTVSFIANGNCNVEELVTSWIKENHINTGSLWAVRSSAQQEDGLHHSFAGMYKTLIHVQVKDLAKAILTVYDAYSVLHNQGPSQQKSSFAIILQEMVHAEYSGVMFSHNPNNISDEDIYISLIPGIGENLVSGKEKSFDIRWSKRTFHFNETEPNYKGQVYRNGLKTIETSGAKMKADVIKHLKHLIKGCQKLYSEMGLPVDIEFAIAKEKIYWLQVRPITTGKDEPAILDNSAAEANYPGIMMPLSLSLIINSFYAGYKNLAVFLGMPAQLIQKNNELLQTLASEINGALYYNVSAWQKLIYQLPFGKKLSKALLNIWGMEKAAFIPAQQGMNAFQKLKLLLKLFLSLFLFHSFKKKFYNQYNNNQLNFQQISLPEKTYAELTEIYKNYENKLTGMWHAPLINNLLTVSGMTLTKKILEKSRLNKKYPNFLNDALYSHGDVVSVTIMKDLLNILKQIKEDGYCFQLFKQQESEIIYSQLNKLNPLLYNNILEYIQKFGDRSDEAELKMETISFKESPLLFFSYLKNNLGADMQSKYELSGFNYKATLKKEYGNHMLKQWLLMGMVTFTINRITDRENFRFLRTKAFACVRQLFREMDAKLLLANQISNSKDTLYLKLKEITDINLTGNFKEIIHERKKQYKEYAGNKIPTRYIQRGTLFETVDMTNIVAEKVDFKGTGCCSGIVKGNVKIVDADLNDTSDCPGKILVANYFEPGKLALFSKAAAIISVRGNLLSHTAILCREMGIPSIVGAKGFLSKVKNGDLIQMDGATGKIKIISGHE